MPESTTGKIVHRIPWGMSYAYTEWEEPEGLDDAARSDWYKWAAEGAVAMEAAVIAAGGGPKSPLAQAAVDAGARPANSRPYRPQAARTGEITCDECGGPTEWSPWRTSPRGGQMRFPECTSGCKKPGTDYPLSGKPQYANSGGYRG